MGAVQGFPSGDRRGRDRPLGHPDHRIPAHRDQRRPLGGQEIKAGDRLGLFYRSANFDEEVFDEPGRFDIGRNPNPHLGYGGLGTHYCLGASLAKLEIQLIFNAIADTMPDIAKAGDPVRLRSGWINGIKSLPVTYRP